jgi:hypothetical protein
MMLTALFAPRRHLPLLIAASALALGIGLLGTLA